MSRRTGTVVGFLLAGLIVAGVAAGGALSPDATLVKLDSGYEKQTPNCLPIMEGWNYTVRLSTVRARKSSRAPGSFRRRSRCAELYLLAGDKLTGSRVRPSPR